MSRKLLNIDIKTAFDLAGGIREVANSCGVSYESARKWCLNNQLPRTEWTGETVYAAAILELINQRRLVFAVGDLVDPKGRLPKFDAGDSARREAS